MAPHNASARPDTPDFLTGGGEVGAMMRAHDWSTSPLGDPAAWSQSLRSVVGLLLNSKFPMFVAWGDELGFLYNDAYIDVLGAKHPTALGRRFHDIWSEIWPDISPLIDAALAGEATYRENLPLLMNRKGFDEQTWFTFSYSPVRDESGRVAGMFCACTETTGQVLAERRLTEEQQALRDSEVRFRALVNASSEAVYRMSSDWTEMRQLDGRGFLADTDAPSVRWLDAYIFPEDRPHVMAAIDEAVRTGGVFELEHRVRRVDGATGWTVSRAVPVVDADGEIVEWFGMASDVTERRRTEERLAESEREMRFALRAGRFGAWSLDLATGEMTTSETCRANFGRDPRAPFTYADLRDAVHPDDRARMAEAVERSVATGTDYDIEYRVITPGGETRWVAIRAQPSYAADGTPLGMAGVSIDATERKRMEAALRDSEARYRALFDSMDEGFCVIEFVDGPHGPLSDYVHVEANPAYTANAGIPDIVGKRLREIVGDEADAWAATYRSVLVSGEPVRFERELVATGRHLELAAFRVEPPERRQVAVLFKDVTARRHAEAALRELADTLEQQVAARTGELARTWRVSQDMLVICEPDGTLAAVNEAWTTALGWSEPELVGGTFIELTHPDDLAPTLAKFNSIFETPLTDPYEYRLRHKDGSYRWIAWTAAFHGGRVFANGRDVTERRARQAELEAAQDALRQSQKMEAMGSLTGGVAHDFNNLLTPIVGSLDLLQRKGLGGERERRLIDGALQSAERARVLVQRLLAFARRQPLQPKPVDLGALVSGMADLVASTSGPQIRVAVDVADGLPAAVADPNQIEMAILNLAVNARDAMPAGGTLRISADARTIGAGHRLRLPPGRYVRLSVADTGAGMDEATLLKAVEPFFSTKGVGRGTGLGLSMVHGLALQLGGALTIDSRPGLGTNVEIWLPVSDADIGDAAPSDDVAARTAVTGTALLVDDEEYVRASTADMLVDLGYAVVEAASAEDALRLVDGGLAPDLLVTDHLMPGVSGTELADELRGRWRGLPVLLVSGYAETEGLAPDLVRLVKPFRQADLAAKLSELDEGAAGGA